MISIIAFLLFLGLIVFGPKKTIEFAQEIGRLVAHAKHAVGQLQESVLAENRTAVTAATPIAQAVEPKN